GPVTYKSSGALRQMVSYVPLENLLLETDSPYLSPEPLRGKVNTPLNISFVYEEVSKIKNIPLDKLIEQIKSNFKLLSN
ncbi:MAG: TatD family hydrolase, partial [Sphaerochaetaceae bacterium]